MAANQHRIQSTPRVGGDENTFFSARFYLQEVERVVFVALESEFRIPSARQYLHQLAVNQLVVGSIPTVGAN